MATAADIRGQGFPSMSEVRSVPVTRRHVVHISGFEPLPAEGIARRLTSGLNRFAPLWGAKASRSEPTISADGRVISFDVETHGPNWTTATKYTVLRWDELMAPYVGRSWLRRVLSGYAALFEFARNGTIRRYFSANFRYGLFVIYPFLVAGLFVALAIVAAIVAAIAGIPAAPVSAPLLGLVAFAGLMRLGGGFFYLDFALADWAFAADLSRRQVTGLDSVLDGFAGEVVKAARDNEADEVLLSSISLGAVMLVEALARGLALDPDLCRHARRLAVLTVGSSILKIGLHPAADRLKQAVTRVGGEPSLHWVEYQAKVDFINFYKTDPVAHLGGLATGKPVVRMVRMREMMAPEDYRRARRNSLLLHRQFIMPNAQRYFYDFYHICFGPMSLAERVALGEGAALAFASDGSYRKRKQEAAPAVAAVPAVK
jgi:hypothetical protein